MKVDFNHSVFFSMQYTHIEAQDKEVFGALTGEEERERLGVELIPSENYVSQAVRAAAGSVFTNKYAEGHPASATMVVSSLLTWWRRSPLSAPNSFLRPALRPAARGCGCQYGDVLCAHGAG